MERRVGDLMRRDFIRIRPEEDLASVAHLMGMARVRALPVVGDGGLAGMISHRVLAREALARARQGRPLDSPIAAFVEPIEPITPDATLRAAAARMIETDLPCLPAVGSAGRLVGLVTEGDLLRAAYESVR